eukprot:3025177-Rhodomonas_salina.2
MLDDASHLCRWAAVNVIFRIGSVKPEDDQQVAAAHARCDPTLGADVECAAPRRRAARKSYCNTA